jgi:hypothetical protein
VLWTNEGYFIPDFRYLVDTMPDMNGFTRLSEIEPGTYFDPNTGYSDTLTVPSVLPDLIDRFERLGGDQRARFLRACYWHHMAGTVWSMSQSLHLTSLINAIECLATVGAERSEPEGPSSLFKSFMKRFAPGAPSGNAIDKLYDVRGEITHGERLLHYDLPPSAMALDERSSTDRGAGDDAIILCRGALLNWLWTEGQAEGAPLLTVGLAKAPQSKAGTKSQVEVTFGQQHRVRGKA